MKINTKNVACPTCGKKETWQPENTFRPFCSERCKLIDLGDWASDKHTIAGETIDPEAVHKEKGED